MDKKLHLPALALGTMLAAGSACAGGLIGYEVTTGDVGLASAGNSARAQDASTVMTNPAGMMRLEGTQTLVNGQMVYGSVSFSVDRTANQASGGDGGNPIGWQPAGSAFVSYSLSPEIKLGFGVASNFGGPMQFDSDWTGRYYNQETNLLGISLLPSVAYRVNDRLSLGLSLNAMYGTYSNKVAINNLGDSLPDGQLKADDNTWGWGANVGLMYEFDSGTRLGITYNSQVNLNFKPAPQFSGLGPLKQIELGHFQGSNLDLGMAVPQGVMGSVFRQINDDWTLLGSIGWQQWSRFGKTDISTDSKSLTVNANYQDTWHGALGAQYRLRPDWLLNFGTSYDSAYQKGSTVTLLNSFNQTWRFGAGVESQIRKGLGWQAALEYVYGGTQNVSNTAILPVTIGGRGDLSGSYKNEGLIYFSGALRWDF